MALVGFGVDSLIELSAGVAAIWRLYSDRDPVRREQSEGIALRLIGACFLALAAYVAADATSSLVRWDQPEESIGGIVIAMASLIVMTLLSRTKRARGAGLNSGALAADGKQTIFCTYLSAILRGRIPSSRW